MKVLVVDDDPLLVDCVSVSLELQVQDCEIVSAAGGDDAVRAFEDEAPNIVLLDIGLQGDKTGFDVLKDIRRVSDVPVIMLTAQSEETQQVRGLEMGADDYVVKPVCYAPLLARMKAVLRRSDMPVPARALPDFEAGDLTVNFESQVLTKADEPVKLTPVEYKLLYHLIRNSGRLMPYAALLARAWGAERAGTAGQLKVFISRLRAKVEPGPNGHRYIETERGLGYKFVRPEGP